MLKIRCLYAYRLVDDLLCYYFCQQSFKNRITIMMDSGIRSGPDIARALASGAEFVFLGRTFMYGVAALGKKGGEHTIVILKRQLQQIMEQISCAKIPELEKHLIKK
ncbi:MAG: alpha-hydroxy-acid oxidizing protein [Acidobacterium ailaaui]|nr:alpha-hydroxy-acid oxidizing protein [Pseudacidobacterium ailaaui]